MVALVSDDQPPSEPEDQWPSIPLAYEFVRPSYEWLAARLDKIEDKSRALLAFGATATFGVPVLAHSLLDASLVNVRSYWFLAALALFVVAMLLGLIIHIWGSLIIPDIKGMYEQTSYSESEFKHVAVYFAGEAFYSNRSLVNKKGVIVNVIAGALCIETVCLLVWMVMALW